MAWADIGKNIARHVCSTTQGSQHMMKDLVEAGMELYTLR